MAEIQPPGIGGAAALAIGVGQHIAGAVQLIIQIVQRTQQHADAVLIQKCDLFGVCHFQPCHILRQAVFFQLAHQGAQSFHAGIPCVRRAFAPGCFRPGGACCVRILHKAERLSRGGILQLTAVQGAEPLGLGAFLGQDLPFVRDHKPLAAVLHRVGGHGFGHLHHHGVGVIPDHLDGAQQREVLLQHSGLFAGLKAEDVLLQLHAHPLQNAVCGIARDLGHLLAVRGLHLNGIDAEQHGHGQVDARANDAQQHGKGGQAAQYPAAAQGGAGHLALFALFPTGRALLRGSLRRAQTLVLAACRLLPVRVVLRVRVVLVVPVVLPAAGIVCRAALFAAGLCVFGSAARRAAAGGVLGGIAPLPLRRTAGLGLGLGWELDAVIRPGGAHTAVGAAGGRAAERLAVVAVAAAAGAPGRMILRRRRGARHIPVQVIGSGVPGSAVAVTVLLHHSHLPSCLFRVCITGSLPA